MDAGGLLAQKKKRTVYVNQGGWAAEGGEGSVLVQNAYLGGPRVPPSHTGKKENSSR